jgi:hypothetical protein
MKSILISILALGFISTNVFATESTCTSAYAVGLGHFFKGEVDMIAQEYSKTELITTEFHEMSFVKGNLQVLDLATNSLIKMKNVSQDESAEFYISTARLSSHPGNWSGMTWGKPFMMIICSEEL